jgi:hypothetical protein
MMIWGYCEVFNRKMKERHEHVAQQYECIDGRDYVFFDPP